MNWNLQATLAATVNRGDRAIALNMMPLNSVPTERQRLLTTLPPDELSVARPISEGSIRAAVEQGQLEAAAVAKGDG